MKNIKKFVEYFKEGCKNEFKIGLEIEHFIVKKNTLESVSYYGENGVKKILEELAHHFQETVYEQGEIIGLSNKSAYITLEPGSQMELSMISCQNIGEIKEIYDWFLEILQPVLERHSYQLYYGGYLPKNKVEDIPLIPKKRYEFMDQYFKKTGIYGKDMMRGTASCQISIDYCDEEDFILKYRIANILVPVLYLITDNTVKFKLPSGKRFAGRAEIWEHVDKERTGIPLCIFDSDFSFKKYAECIQKVPAIFSYVNNQCVYTDEKRIESLIDEYELDEELVQHYLSMVFYDVRLKQYIEIRPGDSMPIEYALAYAALIKGFFSNQNKLKAFYLQYQVKSEDIQQAKEEVMKKGYDAVIYHKNVHEMTMELFQMAEDNLEEEDRAFLIPLYNLVENRRTLAEENRKEEEKQ